MYRLLGTIGAGMLLFAAAATELGCTQSVVTIDGNQLPLADAGKDQTVSDKSGSGIAQVSLDGGNSVDPDGSIVKYEWSTGEKVISESAAPRAEVALPIGKHRIRLTVSDNAGATSTDDVEVTVRAATVSAAALWSEDFESDADGASPTGWLETGRDNSLTATSGLFAVAERDGSKVYGTSSTGDNIHAHFATPQAAAWTNYEFSGRMMCDDGQGGVGVTFFSEFPDKDRYYSLRAYWGQPFELSSRGTTISGVLTSDVVAEPGVWYRFRVEAEDGGAATHVRAKVWRQGQAQPPEWRMVGVDALPSRCTGGEIGVWCMDAGEKWVDDLAVREIDVNTEAGRQLVLTAGPDQVLTDADGDGVVTVTLDGGASGAGVDCYRWREAGRVLAEGPSPVAVVTLSVGYHVITLEPCNGDQGVSDKVEIEIAPYVPVECYTAGKNWRNFRMNRLAGVFSVEFVATPFGDNIDGLFALSSGGGATYSDFAVLVRFNDTGAVDARNGAAYSAETTFPYHANQDYHFRLVVDCSAKTYDAFVAPNGGTERRIAVGYAFRNEQLDVSSLDNWAIQAGMGEYEICDIVFGAVNDGGGGGGGGGTGQAPVADAGADQTILDADGGGETVMLDGRGSYDPDGEIAMYRWKEGARLLAFGAEPTANVALSVGTHPITLTVIDNDGDYGSDSVVVTITAGGGGDGGGTTMASSVHRHGITWTFNREYPVGEFANGDIFVVGPVTITAISPAPGGGRNGSMVNPTGEDVQAYDSRAYQYDASHGVTPPFTLGTNKSLVSTKSASGGYTNLDTAAVLTCLSAAPPDGTFRPPYCGESKPLYNVSQLRMGLLPSLSPVAGTPNVDVVAGKIERVWLDHQPYWHGKYIHPQQNMPGYGREISTQINDASLMAMLNVPNKDTLVIRLVQLGIDFNGIAEAGGSWQADGGHASGRKWPILFAGFMLNESSMLNIGQRGTTFGEDCQTFYVTQADIDSGVGYTQGQLGLPEWGIRHCYAPDQDNPAWDAPYRQCCTANAWVGAVLSAHLLDLVDEWNHPALFDYQDRYMSTETGGDFRSWSRFAEMMWNAYR